jgi:rhodanese-related sulfurtransferase
MSRLGLLLYEGSFMCVPLRRGFAALGRIGGLVRLGDEFMITRRSAVVATASWLLAGVTARAGETVGFEEVQAGVTSGRILLVDVREPDEFVVGHVPGAINLPLSSFEASRLPAPAGQRVVLICRSGRRAMAALEKVEATGRRDVAVYVGSMNDWTARRGAIVTGR